MLNMGPDGQLMVFFLAKLAIKPGDSVKFVATDKWHNAELVAGMAPAGALPPPPRADLRSRGRLHQGQRSPFDTSQ